MPRKARAKSETNIYHIMLRGNNRETIFHDREDCIMLLRILKKCKQLSQFQLYAYCLMGNHVHLLLQSGPESIDQVMKRICTRYVKWYNAKYGRVGHLFQDRFKSEPVCDAAYFCTVLRYILNNPVKAGICKQVTDYPLSSINDYVHGGGITDTTFAERILGRDRVLEYLTAKCNDNCMDESMTKISMREARKRFCEIVGLQDAESCKQAVVEHPEQYVKALRNGGLSIRQICQLTELSFGIVRKY